MFNTLEDAETESVVLEELNHRFSNMLQILGSTLGQIVADSACVACVGKNVADFRERVVILADFHRRISLGPNPLETLESHVRDLVVQLLRAFGREDVTPWVTMADVHLPPNRQRLLTLLIMELVINALKHGDKEAGGLILVDLTWSGTQQLHLSIFNDHPASPISFAVPRIASELARSLGGVFGICGTGGYAAHLEFAPLAATAALAATQRSPHITESKARPLRPRTPEG